MAQIIEEVVVIKLSKLVKDPTQSTDSAITQELIATLEEVAQELVGDAIIVEVEKS